MNTVNNAKLSEILMLFPMRLKNLFFSLNEETKSSIREIRLRINKPITVVTNLSSSFLGINSKLTYILSDALPIVTADEMNEIVKRACNYSVYSYQQDMTEGYITVKGGSRIGLCGRAVNENGKTVSVRDISSLNIRVAGEYYGCADELVKTIYLSKPCNLIISGPPMSGKTTVVRDLVRQLADGNSGRYFKCVICDERNEIACMNEGRCCCDVGANTDVVCGYDKATAVEIAVRSLSPDIVFCDEVTSEKQVQSILDGILCGCSFVVTAHCDSLIALKSRPVSNRLVSSGLFDYAIFLGTKDRLGKVIEKVNLKENCNENSCFDYITDDTRSDCKLFKYVD